MSRLTQEMFSLTKGRHVHRSTSYPGGVDTVPTIQRFTDYLVRLMKYIDFMKKVVPLHDDIFDFFYYALPGYEKPGQRRILVGFWGSFNNPEFCDYTYQNLAAWEREMYVTPGLVVDDIYGRPGHYEEAEQNTPIFEENGPDKFKGMRAVRNMYHGGDKLLEAHHSPMFGAPR